MEDDPVTRRKVLALLGTAGIATLFRSTMPSSRVVAGDTRPQNGSAQSRGSPGAGPTGTRWGQDANGVPPATSTATPRPTPEDTLVSVTEFGATLDGVTDDTDALRRAIDAAAPDGTITIPTGTLRITARGSEDNTAIRLDQRHSDVTLVGAGPAKTVVRMAPDHAGVHRGILIAPDEGTSIDGLEIRDLTLDGQGIEQDYRVGLGIEVAKHAKRQSVTLTNVVIENWAVNGVTVRAPGTRVRRSTLRTNGEKSTISGGYDGHGLVSTLPDGAGETVAEDVLFEGNTGAALDNGGGAATLRNCVVTGCGYGVKLNEGTTTQVVEDVYISDCRSEPGIYSIAADQDDGTLVLNRVRIDGAPNPGLYLPSGSKIRGDQIAIQHTSTAEDLPAGVVIYDEGRTVDIGRLSVHGTVGGAAVALDTSTGTIERLVHGNNDAGLGRLGGVSVGEIESGDPLSFPTPTAIEVGARIGPHGKQRQ